MGKFQRQVVEKGNGDLFYTGDLLEAREAISEEADFTISVNQKGIWQVLIAEGVEHGKVTWENADEWGTGPDFETACRFAAGAYFGNYIDVAETRLEPEIVDKFRWATSDECEDILNGTLEALWGSESDTGEPRGYLVKVKDAEATE